jgi:hypothetical protein
MVRTWRVRAIGRHEPRGTGIGHAAAATAASQEDCRDEENAHDYHLSAQWYTVSFFFGFFFFFFFLLH